MPARRVTGNMTHTFRVLVIAACVLTAAQIERPAYGSDFTSFAEDENVCRQAGAEAIKGAAGPEAAHRYDMAHWRCMAAHGQARQMRAYQDDGPPRPGDFTGRPDNSDFPDAYYSVPYATPGYGYDGFSY